MTEPNRVTSLTEITSHVRDGLALFSQQFRGKERIEALATVLLTQVQEAEAALFDLYSDGLDTATDAQLDQIGELLGRPRAGLSDNAYRTVLRGTAKAIASSGTMPELYDIADTLLDVDFTLRAYTVATVQLEPTTHPTLDARLTLEVVRRAKAAGVRLLVVDVPSGDAFTLSDTSDTDTGDADHGLSDTTGTPGGKLVGVLEG
jgi:hypothetical protein